MPWRNPINRAIITRNGGNRTTRTAQEPVAVSFQTTAVKIWPFGGSRRRLAVHGIEKKLLFYQSENQRIKAISIMG